VGGGKPLEITLLEDTQALEEVVVVGYGTQRKGNLTGSVAAIRSEQITIAPRANVSNSLVGQLPGLIAKQNSGLPGSDQASLTIRGFGGALIIIDGVEGNMNNIDPDQIESVSILKDGAASIYGARAGNGVILVTTKRGISQKPTITFNSSYTLQGVTAMLNPASSGQRAEMEREKYLHTGGPESGAPWTAEAVAKFYAGNDPAYPSYNWLDFIVRDWAPEQNHNLSVRGGNDKLKFMGYLGYLDQETMIKKNGGGYTRYNIQANVDASITQRLTVSVDLLLAYEDRIFPYRELGNGSAIWQDIYTSRPWYPPVFANSEYLSWSGIDTGSPYIMSNMELSGYRLNKQRDLRGSIGLVYDFKYVDGLKAKAFVNYRDNEGYSKQWRKPATFYTYNAGTDAYTMVGNFPATAELYEAMDRYSIMTQQYSLNYDRLFNSDHRITALALYESMDYYNNTFSASRINYITSAIEQLFAGGTEGLGNNGSASEMGRVSFVGRANYSYKDRYLLETILRADASAKFPKDHRWGYFPSVSLGWVISQEDFMKSTTAIDNLKLRASYGVSGNDGVANFNYLSGYGFSQNTQMLGDSEYKTLLSTGIANPLLTWETMTIYNAGLDFSFLQRKLYGSAEIFYRLRDGIPGTRSRSLPSTFGASLPQENLNTLSDRGFEFELGTSQKAGDFFYDIKANISWSRAKWDYYDEPDYADPDQKRISSVTGKWSDRQVGYKSAGLFTSQAEIDALPYSYSAIGGNSSLRPGDVKYLDINGDNVLDWKDQQDIGSGTTPHWMFGIAGNFAYRDFDLQTLFQGAFGYYSNTFGNLGSGDWYYDEMYKLRWTDETNDPNALVARLGGSASNRWTSDYYYKPTSYIRLKTASFGYNVPKSFLQRWGVERLRLYLAGTNLFTVSSISKYGLDPEFPNTAQFYPQQRTISCGLNLSF
jgi:TonB-linked SusC/RagA family outer membrane protein